MTPEVSRPELGANVYIAPTAYVAGAVTIGDECTLMHQVVVRGDVSSIRLGKRVNVQDGTILHTKKGIPLIIEDEVTIGHRAVVHCRRVGTRALIGIGAIVLDDAEIGAGALVAAGAVVLPGTEVPPGKLVAGVPARVIRDVSDTDRAYMQRVVGEYVNLGQAHAAGQYPSVTSPGHSS
jgi:carbonic anhydrase/acetyltransferase-like protein (isoleucine patch superfamily)